MTNKGNLVDRGSSRYKYYSKYLYLKAGVTFTVPAEFAMNIILAPFTFI